MRQLELVFIPQPKSPLLTEAQIGYLAGILDGEGYIGLCGDMKKGFTLRIAIASGSKKMVDWLAATFGVGRVTSFDLAHRNRKTSHQCRAFGAEAGSILRAALPHLIIKRRQAVLGLRYQDNKALSGKARSAFGRKISERIKRLNSRHRKQKAQQKLLAKPRIYQDFWASL